MRKTFLHSLALALACALTASGTALATPGSPTRDTLSATLAPAAAAAVPQGAPFKFTATLTSQDSFAQELEFQLIHVASGAKISFVRDLAVVPAGVTVTMNEAVIPAQWFAKLGKYQIVPFYNDQQLGPALTFTVARPTVQAPVFQNVTAKARLSTSIGVVGCKGFTSGAAWADINGDGLLDLYVTRLTEPARLFIHHAGHTFSEEAAARGVAGDGAQADGAVFADYDNDGDPDLLVVGDSMTHLYRNDAGRFTDVTAQAGLTNPGYMSLSGSFADYDSDGRLDLYITTHSHCVRADFLLYKQEPDLLYHGNPDGTFTNVTGIIQPDHSTQPNLAPGAGFQAAWVDFDADNRQDLILANDYIGPTPDRNRLWQNAGKGADGGWHFTDISAQAGVNTAMNAMGIAVADFNRDLKPDFALSNIEGNKLFRNDGDMVFTEVGYQTAMHGSFQRARRPSVTWGTESGDFNLDGWPDFYFAAGYLIDWGVNGLGFTDTPQHNQVFVNDRKGAFATLSAPSHADDAGQSRSVATADYDRDGRLDLYVVNQGGEPHLFRNVSPLGPSAARSHWLEVDTVGNRSNRDGCGTVVVAKVNGASLWREVFCGSTSVSAGSSKIVHFGLGAWGKKAPAVSLEVRWPSGVRQALRGVKVDRLLRLAEPKV